MVVLKAALALLLVEVPDVAAAAAATVPPHPTMGLLPGSASSVPAIFSLGSAGEMLQEVEGSLRPPIKPGHLSMPLSPALQLSMIC